MSNTIKYFMWGYQQHFRISLELQVETAFRLIGLNNVDLEVILIGVRAPDRTSGYPICIEPENEKWDLDIFDTLKDTIKEEIENHPLKNMFYSNDEQRMRDKPESIRRDSISIAVRKLLLPYDEVNNVKSFTGLSTLVEGYYVVPVIQISKETFRKHPALDKKTFRDKNLTQGYLSFIEALCQSLLSEASTFLKMENPGREYSSSNTRETVRKAADTFMYTPTIAIYEKYSFTNLFETLNLISSLFYEGVRSLGKIIISDPTHEAIVHSLEFQNPVEITNIRWVRKILEMSSNELSLIADNEYIYGLGHLEKDYNFSDQKIFTVQFLDHYYWQIKCGAITLLQSHYNEPSLAVTPINSDLLIENLERLYPKTGDAEQQYILKLVFTLIELNRGSMLVIAEDAETEVQRLASLGTPIKPILLTPLLLEQASGIDGTVIIDPKGLCFGIGMILDGDTIPECTPSRGSRYNSGVRYVYPTQQKRRLAIVVSDDKTIDIIPKLRPMIRLNEIEHNINLLEVATLDNYHQPRNWIVKNRFYFNEEQCNRVNIALDRIEKLPNKDLQLIIITNRLSPHKDMDENYLKD